MNVDDLQKIIATILNKAKEYKEIYINEPLGPVDYVGIFSQNHAQRESLINLMHKLEAKVVYSDNDGSLYHSPKKLQIGSDDVDLIKICNVNSIYNPKRNKLGYVDYRATDYSLLKQKYGKQNPFTYIYGEGWEILSLEQPDVDVSVYIPNIPLSKDLGFS
jgi:hypothetical protein